MAQETAGAALCGAGKQDSPALSKLVTGHNDTKRRASESERERKNPSPRSGASARLVGAQL